MNCYNCIFTERKIYKGYLVYDTMTTKKRNRTKYFQEYRKRPEVKSRRYEKGKKWRQENPEKCKEYFKKYNSSKKGKEYRKKWEKENTEKRRGYNKKSYYKNGGYNSWMRDWRKNTLKGTYTTYKSNSKRINRPFKLSLKDFKKFWGKPCFYCGDEIKTIGIDRIDNKKGYIQGNLRSCCHICNSMKSSLTQKQFYEQIKKISSLHHLK